MLGRRVLRARTPADIEQEIYALLAVYQIIRIAIADATGSAPGTDPDRASFTVALEAARTRLSRLRTSGGDRGVHLLRGRSRPGPAAAEGPDLGPQRPDPCGRGVREGLRAGLGRGPGLP